MRDLRVLYLGKNDTSRITSQPRYLREELSKRVTVLPYGKGWSHPDLDASPRMWERDVVKIARVFKPDLVYISLLFDWCNLDKLDIPVFYWYSDPHYKPDVRVDWINRNKIDVSLHVCLGNEKRYGLKRLQPLFFKGHRAVFFTHAVNLDVFKDYGLERIYDVAFLGRNGRPVYPLRVKLRDWLKTTDLKILQKQRPRSDYGWTKQKLACHPEVVAGESYARALSQCKIMPTGTSVYGYPSNKIFEAMATKTLVLTNPPISPEAYHLELDHNFVGIGYYDFGEHRYGFRNEIMRYVADDVERQKIVERAYRMVRKYHSTKTRVDQLIKLMEDIL